jgi:phenylalanyl-tRNA synthetase beta chain
MIVSVELLKKFIYPWDINNDVLYDILNSVGLEVEQVTEFESIPGQMNNIIIGEVLQVEKIEGTDHLHKTLVNIGESSPLTIVCGAPNVAKGQKVVVALPGSFVRFGNEWTKLKKSKIRGIESNGMICAEDELGIGHSHAGILVLSDDVNVSEKANKIFKDFIYKDTIYQIGLTPNRADATSHLGIARDIFAALNQRFPQVNYKFLLPDTIDIHPNKRLPISIKIDNAEACPKYCGLVIDNVSVKESPLWLKNYLNAWGLKSINNIVDISQYVMMEIGQPLHIFDYDKIKGHQVIVKTANESTKFKFLDGIERELSNEDLMICNAEEPMCMAGIMGGIDSGVSDNTKTIFIESAFFNPSYIRRSARRHNLHTEAAYRYERGADYSILNFALHRAAKLILDVSGGEISSDIIESIGKVINNEIISFNIDKTNNFLGTELHKDNVKKILLDLNFDLLDEKDDILTVKVPMAKVDVKQPVDIAEELIRIAGFDKIESPKRVNYSIKPFKSQYHNFTYNLSIKLKAEGFTEIMNNSLESENYYKQFNLFTEDEYVKVLNPISKELNILRPSLLFGGLKSIAYNLNRQEKNLLFFEFGKIYKIINAQAHNVKEKFYENQQLAIWMTGNLFADNWKYKSNDIDLFDIKSIIENIFYQYIKNKQFDYNETEHRLLINSFEIYNDNKLLSTIGEVKNDVLRYFDIDAPVYYAEIYLENLYESYSKNEVKYAEPNKFPIVKRDLSLLLNDDITFQQIKDVIYKAAPKYVKDINLFDVYEGKNLPAGKISYAISINLEKKQSTFTEQEIDNLMKKIVDALNTQLGIILRG